MQTALHSKSIRESIEPVSIPAMVLDAMATDFGVAITGYLICAAAEGVTLIGIVFGDNRGRFKNGHSIRTSVVMGRQVIHGHVIIETLNSRYVVCDWAQEGLGPRFTGVHH
ncbi:hypothetical protein OKW98_15740 [Pseudomonas sp. KU26590]|uniref:hypothetical protein n=1 Tax=Pseudomonas sp. KU26590 TaxID=2991051 RepID=UPI00223D9E0A|nr:hypothetical protein [Pseudomonas sp. KU26590]UZJ58065.1 hypothetical protein OKW98_15740 [Pseudomonas sp. KU26590]